MLQSISVVYFLLFGTSVNVNAFSLISFESIYVRKRIINAQQPDKKILDIGCGLGFSTSSSKGSLGIDDNMSVLNIAAKTFPEKRFQHGDVMFWDTDEKFDIVTSMFYMHENPSPVRQKVIEMAKKHAKERVIIVDLAPEFEPCDETIAKNPHMENYLDNCRSEMAEFSERVIMNGKINVWILDLNTEINNEEELDSLDKVIRFYRPT